jgi:SAM-dependent methyltransferase
MIIHKLILQHLKHRDDAGFYELQARDAIGWLERAGVVFGTGTTVLDLGCGHGIFGGLLLKRGCPVTFADYGNGLIPEFSGAPFKQIDIDKEDLAVLGTYDVVICSNVYEHLARPDKFLQNAAQILQPGGKLYLSWTNWLSIWGGHEFSPFHYFGPGRGHRIYDKIRRRPRKHTPYENLFPTYIGETMGKIQRTPGLRVLKTAPRYYPEFGFLMGVPVLREFLAWNCAMLIVRT